MSAEDESGQPPQKRARSRGARAGAGRTKKPALRPAAEPREAVNEFIARQSDPGRIATVQAQVPAPSGEAIDPSDEKVVDRVEHSNRGIGWVLITAGVVGMVVPGVLGTPFLILGGLALWPGNRKRVERWRQGHSPKMFHGAMKQINRFLDDLERRYPRIGR